jgi:hypothetical protein
VHGSRRLDPEQLEKVAVAAAFHDLGIWTDGTFDYLPPSIRLAREWLGQSGKAEWEPEISVKWTTERPTRAR